MLFIFTFSLFKASSLIRWFEMLNMNSNDRFADPGTTLHDMATHFVGPLPEV
jgi:hypothetical protein